MQQQELSIIGLLDDPRNLLCVDILPIERGRLSVRWTSVGFQQLDELLDGVFQRRQLAMIASLEEHVKGCRDQVGWTWAVIAFQMRYNLPPVLDNLFTKADMSVRCSTFFEP